jgi:hypothetical protein
MHQLLVTKQTNTTNMYTIEYECDESNKYMYRLGKRQVLDRQRYCIQEHSHLDQLFVTEKMWRTHETDTFSRAFHR